MDERIEEALKLSKYMTTLNNQKRILKEQFALNSLHYTNGGQFTVSQVLISFAKTLIDKNQTDAVLIDDHGVPIFIENLSAFLDDILDVYYSASNKYITEYNELKTKRSVEGLIIND